MEEGKGKGEGRGRREGEGNEGKEIELKKWDGWERNQVATLYTPVFCNLNVY